jgi:hypothetical protein
MTKNEAERGLRLKQLAPSGRSRRRSRIMVTRSASSVIDAALGRKDLALDEGRRAHARGKDVINGGVVLQYSPSRQRGQAKELAATGSGSVLPPHRRC